MATATQSRQMKRTLGDLLTKLSADEKTTKESASKSKKADTGDPGGYTSDTTHPSKNVDDGTQAAPEGSHGAENNARVKEDEPLGIPDATPNDSGSQNEVQVDLGITSKSTGTDPAVEGDVKDRPEDPGTTSEVDTSVGEKYSAFQKMAKQSEETGSQFLAVLNKLAGAPEPAKSNGAQKPAAATKTADSKDPPAEKQAEEAVAGYEMAAAIAALPEQDKEAAVKGIHDIVHQTVSRAANLATKTAEYLMGVNETLKKKAEGELPPELGGGGGEGEGNGEGGGPPAAEGNGENGGGEPDADDGSGGGAPGGLSEADLIQLLTQGDQMGGAGGPPGAGGGGLDALLAGAGGGGGPPPDMGGGGMPPGGGGAGGEQIDPAMLEQILQEVGATGGDLEKAMAAKEAAARTVTTKQAAGRAKWGPKYDQVKKSVADLLGRKI